MLKNEFAVLGNIQINVCVCCKTLLLKYEDGILLMNFAQK
jgi:hypothetical protein